MVKQMDGDIPGGPGSFEDRIYGLLAIAEEQQTAVRALINDFAIERGQLVTQRAALSEQAGKLKTLSDQLVQTFLKAGPDIASQTHSAATSAVERALAGAATIMTKAVHDTASPAINGFTDAIGSAKDVQFELKKAVAHFERRWTFLAAGISLCSIVVAALLAYAGIYWQGQEIARLGEQREKLAADITALQNQAEQAKQMTKRRGTKP